MNFSGPGVPLTQAGLDYAAGIAEVGVAELWALMSVETSGCGFLADRRPKILFERHIFSRLTDGRFDADDPDISQPSQGGYGTPGAHQYDRLCAALTLNEAAALQSASWGLGQVMGENFRDSGFATIDDMVAGMIAHENNQLKAIVAFLKATGMDESLREHNWTSFARRYNGPNFAANNYDGLLDHFYEIYSAGVSPSVEIRAVQIALTYKGFPVGRADGVMGDRTANAVKAFQVASRLPAAGQVDAALRSALGL
jgi:N-acetylmuramidase/Putative peptidoglycan binding domain